MQLHEWAPVGIHQMVTRPPQHAARHLQDEDRDGRLLDVPVPTSDLEVRARSRSTSTPTRTTTATVPHTLVLAPGPRDRQGLRRLLVLGPAVAVPALGGPAELFQRIKADFDPPPPRPRGAGRRRASRPQRRGNPSSRARAVPLPGSARGAAWVVHHMRIGQSVPMRLRRNVGRGTRADAAGNARRHAGPPHRVLTACPLTAFDATLKITIKSTVQSARRSSAPVTRGLRWATALQRKAAVR